MRSAGRKQVIQENTSSKNEVSIATSQAEEFSEPSSSNNKPAAKKNASPINLSDGLPMHTTIEQLRTILTQPAHNIADRAVLLDARDRLVRLRKDAKDKSLGVKKVSVLKGTCLDMCPEKERYSRAEKHRLALYEMLVTQEKDYDVDHRLAVKEYSRSSADQAEPLAHELRPLSVLQMTMDYLISRIVDRCDRPGENLGDWFNFLWDRMRGIRKDITQQSLCEQGSVDLVEKCARFHIHCTSHLCELDMQDFDQKINDENLTKCLQTLKHMYYDLSVKNVYCVNEAEFRSYDVLLHLNDGEILREVLQLRAEVRDSHEVRSALEFVNTLNSRNYVRFFKLANSNRDYFQCCLLQRYFPQIRNQALQIMVQAYGPPKKGQMQLSSLINLLGFEDKEEAALWCECHGLPFDEKTVKFERVSFIELPEKFPPMRRSSLIEKKRISSVSNCISKGLVPEDPTLHHIPLNSFDSSGLLLQEAWLVEGQQAEIIKVIPSSITQPSIRLPETLSVSPNLIESVSVRVRNQIINTTVEETLIDLAQNIVAQNIVAQNCIMKTTFSIFNSYVEEFTKDLCKEVISEIILELQLAKRQQEQQKLDLQRKLKVWSNQVFCEVVDSFVNDQVKSLSFEAIQAAVRLRASIIKDKCAQRMLELLVSEIITLECRAVASVVAYEAIETRESMVQRVSELVNKNRVRRWIGKWRNFTALQIRRRKEKQTFPACPSRKMFAQQISQLKSKGEPTSGPLKRKSLAQQSACVKRFNCFSDLQFHLMNISSSLDEKVFDLFTLVEQSLKNDFDKERNRCWKLVILAISEENIGDVFRKWFGFSTVEQNRDGWFYTDTRNTPNSFTLSVCFVNTCDWLEHFLNGANALLVVYDPLSEVEATYLQTLAQMIQNYSKYIPLPVATIASKTRGEASQLFDQILQPCFHVALSFDNPSVDKHSKLVEIFSTLIKTGQLAVIPPSIRLCTTTLWNLANDFVSHKILSTIYRDMQLRLQNELPHRSLSQLIDFNNHAVQFLSENVVSDTELNLVKWPAPELVQIPYLNFPPANWNSAMYQLKMKNALEKYLVLPILQSGEQSFTSMCTVLRKYCEDLSMMEADATPFFSRVDCILAHSKELMEEHGLHQNDDIRHEHIIPWTDIFQACVDYRLLAFTIEGSRMLTGYFARALDETNVSWVKTRQLLDATDLRSTFFEVDAQQVYHEQAELLAFKHEAQSINVPYEISSLCDAITDNSKQSHQENQRFEAILLRALTPEKKSVKCTPVKNSSTPVSIDDHLELLERKLRQSRCDNHNFESILKRALDDV